jgi:hypothetical protein
VEIRGILGDELFVCSALSLAYTITVIPSVSIVVPSLISGSQTTDEVKAGGA